MIDRTGAIGEAKNPPHHFAFRAVKHAMFHTFGDQRSNLFFADHVLGPPLGPIARPPPRLMSSKATAGKEYASPPAASRRAMTANRNRLGAMQRQFVWEPVRR